MIAQYGRFLCKDGEEEDFENILRSLTPVVSVESNPVLSKNKVNALSKQINFYDSLVCYDSKALVGVCLYRHTSTHIEVLHMYVDPKYRVTYGCGLINHYLINVIAKGKELMLKSEDISTFDRVIDKTKTPHVYTINDRARLGLKRMFKDKIQWSE